MKLKTLARSAAAILLAAATLGVSTTAFATNSGTSDSAYVDGTQVITIGTNFTKGTKSYHSVDLKTYTSMPTNYKADTIAVYWTGKDVKSGKIVINNQKAIESNSVEVYAPNNYPYQLYPNEMKWEATHYATKYDFSKKDSITLIKRNTTTNTKAMEE